MGKRERKGGEEGKGWEEGKEGVGMREREGGEEGNDGVAVMCGSGVAVCGCGRVKEGDSVWYGGVVYCILCNFMKYEFEMIGIVLE